MLLVVVPLNVEKTFTLIVIMLQVKEVIHTLSQQDQLVQIVQAYVRIDCAIAIKYARTMEAST